MTAPPDKNIARAALESAFKGGTKDEETPAEDAEEARQLSEERAHAFNMRREGYLSTRQFRRFRTGAFSLVVIFSLIPLWMIFKLTFVLFSADNLTAFFMSSDIGPSPKIALITGTIAAFLVVFGFLARGAFNSRRREQNDAENESI